VQCDWPLFTVIIHLVIDFDVEMSYVCLNSIEVIATVIFLLNRDFIECDSADIYSLSAAPSTRDYVLFVLGPCSYTGLW